MHSGRWSVVEFKAEDWRGRYKHDVSGYIYENEEAFKNKHHPNSFFLHGKYSEYVHAWRTDAEGNHKDEPEQPEIVAWVIDPPIERREM